MIPNCNDGTANPPRLRLDISGGTVAKLPPTSTFPTDPRAAHAALRAAGFEGVQGGDLALCREFSLARTGAFRINKPSETDAEAKKSKEAGEQCATIHAGWGMETDAEADALVDSVLNASAKYNHPLFIETHRATITQDLYRTVALTRRFPDVRFNGDFSHWYTGLEMVYGGFEEKLAFVAPVLDRVRFVHGRIGNPGSIQVDVGPTAEVAMERPYVRHFVALWTQAFRGFLASAGPGDVLPFTPELLPPDIYYARTLPDGREEGDRWQQACVLAELARRCWDAAGS